MEKTKTLVPILLLNVLIGFGIFNQIKIGQSGQAVFEWQRDTALYNLKMAQQQWEFQHIEPGEDLIRPREQQPVSALADPFLNASQGVEVHLEGIRWMGKWFNSEQKNGIDLMGGLAEVQINQLVFDPDFEKAGLPDLNVELTAPRFFEINHFLSDWLSGFQLGGSLGKTFGGSKPVETYDLKTSPGKRQKMSHWLLEFDAFIRIEPSPVYDGTNYGGLDKHPVSGIPVRKILSDKEAKNQRYGNLSVMLKFKPKSGTWYIAQPDQNGSLVPNSEPKIGIAAVECVGIKPEAENKNLNNIGVFLRIGSSLALYPSPRSIDENFIQNRIEEQKVLIPLKPVVADNGILANPDLFDREKYAIIHLANIGSWQEGSWLSTTHRYADQYHARFIIHTYVLGEWDVKPVSIAVPQSRPPFEMRKPGVKDFFLPDLSLGWLGRFLSGTGWVIILLVVLNLFFPVTGKIISKILSSVYQSTVKLFRKHPSRPS